jgi:hypothetical protein
MVYVVKDDTVQPRKVDLQYTSGERAVVAGLMPSEQIVVEGKQNLRPGSRIRIEKTSAQAPSAKRDPS